MTDNRSSMMADVKPENYFVMSDGKVVKNLQGLYDAVKDSSEDDFAHHVNTERNDFANWIKYCVRDTELSEKIMPVQIKEVFLGTLADEIRILKDNKIYETMKYFKDDLPTEKPSENSPAKISEQSPGQLSLHDEILAELDGIDDIPTALKISSSNPVGLNQSSLPASEPENVGITNLSTNNEEVMEFETLLQPVIVEIEREIFGDDA